MGWFVLKSLGLPRYLWLILGIAAIFAVGLWLAKAEEQDDRRNQELGATVEREEALGETLERTETGNAVREETRRTVDAGASSELHTLCLRTARTPANCDRYLLPERPADQR